MCVVLRAPCVCGAVRCRAELRNESIVLESLRETTRRPHTLGGAACMGVVRVRASVRAYSWYVLRRARLLSYVMPDASVHLPRQFFSRSRSRTLLSLRRVWSVDDLNKKVGSDPRQISAIQRAAGEVSAANLQTS